MERSSLALVLAVGLATTACGAEPARRPSFDRMIFAEDDAVEAIRPARPAAGTRARERSQTANPGRWTLPQAQCANDKDEASRSVGSATDGALYAGCLLPSAGFGYTSRHKTLYGTDEVVAILQWATGYLATQHPNSPPVVIGALSAESGGRLRPHKSHQSGRDVDIGYLRSDGGALERFVRTDRYSLDVERTWTLLHALLYAGDVEYIFVDHDIQAALWHALADADWDEELLARLFQYPDPPTRPRGIIRHAAGHADHFHVRFRCAARDRPDCQD